MGLQQKLDRAYQEGFQDGQKAKNETLIRMARNDAFILGAKSTWDILYEMIPNLQGVGPKTRDKLLRAIQEQAKKEKEKIQRN
jgi:hypothetical protein